VPSDAKGIDMLRALALNCTLKPSPDAYLAKLLRERPYPAPPQ
jgi:hypothetical protein